MSGISLQSGKRTRTNSCSKEITSTQGNITKKGKLQREGADWSGQATSNNNAEPSDLTNSP